MNDDDASCCGRLFHSKLQLQKKTCQHRLTKTSDVDKPNISRPKGQGQELDLRGQGQGLDLRGQGQSLDLRGQSQSLDLRGQGQSLDPRGQGQGLDLRGQGQGTGPEAKTKAFKCMVVRPEQKLKYTVRLTA